MSKFCPKCGNKIEKDDIKFCSKCGNKFINKIQEKKYENHSDNLKTQEIKNHITKDLLHKNKSDEKQKIKLNIGFKQISVLLLIILLLLIGYYFYQNKNNIIEKINLLFLKEDNINTNSNTGIVSTEADTHSNTGIIGVGSNSDLESTKKCISFDKDKYTDIGYFNYSFNGKNFIFLAKNKDGKYIIVKDGIEIDMSQYDNISNLTYSPNGKDIAFITKKDGKNILVKDSEEIDMSKYENIYNLTYSTDGKSFAFTAEKDGKNILNKDGIEIYSTIDFIHFPTYSPDGKSFAFVTSGIEDRMFNSLVIKDGVKSKSYWAIFKPIYSPDGKSFAFFAKKDGKDIIVKDGIEIYGNNPVYSPDGKSFAFTADKDEKDIIVKDGIEINTSYDIIKTLIYSPDGKSFSFVAYNQKDSFKPIIVKEGKEIGIYDNFFETINTDNKYIKYSPDGKSFAFTAEKDGKNILVKDNQEIDIVSRFSTNYFYYSNELGTLNYAFLDENNNFNICNIKY